MQRGIELTVVVQRDVKPWRYPPNRDFQYGDWLRLALERGEAEPWAAKSDPDLASLIAQVLAADVVLLGLPSAEVFDPVPFSDVLDAIVANVDKWVENIDDDTRKRHPCAGSHLERVEYACSVLEGRGRSVGARKGSRGTRAGARARAGDLPQRR